MKGTKPRLVVDNDAVRTVPRPPAWMSKDAAAEWRRVLPALVERRILTTADLGSLENYCTAIGQVREAERHIRQHGLVFEVFKEGLDGQIVSLGAGLGLGGVAYVAVCQLLRVPELDQVAALVRRRSS